MSLAKLLKKRLIFISGKGGVGKTTICLVLAAALAEKKKKTLLLELNSLGQIRSFFDVKGDDHQEIALAPYISHINLRPPLCFEEYVLKQIRFKALYKAFLDNKFVTHFTEAVPGLAPILMLGKIHYLLEEVRDDLEGAPLYDNIIVDCPATGHGLSLFEVPHILKAAVKLGPLHHRATEIVNMLGNKSQTVLCPVTLAEEMPVTETIEFIERIQKQTNLPLGPLFINCVWEQLANIKFPKEFPKELTPIKDYYDLVQNRSALNKDNINKLVSQLDHPESFVLPYFKEGLEDYSILKKLLKEMSSL